ncbi:Cuticlin-1 [Frankliniella fusca]|uniref:Cuticlin-1 n=1 Tax=Frankliniella fusca TaxID=407009 RepID=A0AAE1HJR2_9NEOP|nr:Cuticlin-1 [Frankliniella fusca]
MAAESAPEAAVVAAPTQNQQLEPNTNSNKIESPSGSDQEASETAPKHGGYAPPPLGPGPGPLGPPPRGHPLRGPPPPPPSHKPYKNAYHGPPPPLGPPLGPPLSGPSQGQPEAMDKLYGPPALSGGLNGGGDPWPVSTPDMPKIVSLDVKCEKNAMKVFLSFDKPFYGIVFSKGHYSNVNCVHLPAGLGRTSANFEISIHACGTAGNTENGLYGYGADSGSGTYFENIIVVQYDPQVQEVWDQARKLRCTWHDQYEKSVTFRPFPVDMLDVVRADFAGDNVGCWMQIQVGKGPWASEVSGLVKIGQTMTMVLAIKDDDSKFDMLVRNCMAHDGKRAPIQLVDQKGCVTRPKLMSRFTKIKNFGASASVLSYAHFQAFKFPDSMEVHFQCTIQICRYQCPDQCSDGSLPAPPGHGGPQAHVEYGPPQHGGHGAHAPLEAYLQARSSSVRDERKVRVGLAGLSGLSGRHRRETQRPAEVGVNRIIRVVSTGDLTFSLDEAGSNASALAAAPQGPTMVLGARDDAGLICMTTPGFAATLVVLLAILVVSCLLSAFLCVRLRPFAPRGSDKQQTAAAFSHHPVVPVLAAPVHMQVKAKSKSCFYS